MEELLQLDAGRTTAPSRLPWEMEEVNTPLRWQAWERSLEQHPDPRFRAYIANGIRFGFRVGYTYQHPCRTSSRNMPSALERPEVVREYLATECSEGRVLGPLDPTKFPQIHTSRFGVIPKGSTGRWRLIVDMSSPEGGSVNDGIPEELCSLSYVGIKDAARAILDRGRGAMMAKVDVKSAYRNIPVHPEDRWMMGMMWEGALFVDTCLPFGLRSAPKIFTAIADAVEWIVCREGASSIMHYLDDFLVVGAPNSSECVATLTTLLRVFDRLGLPVALEKLEGPLSCLVFLGFELDSEARVIRLPQLKLRELQFLIRSWVGRQSCTKKDLESLVGKLAHASQVVRPGKTFMRRMFELLAGTRLAHHHIRLSKAFRSDLLWWATFLEVWNGITMMQGGNSSQVSHQVWTDASGHFGCGAWWPAADSWLQLRWQQAYTKEWEALHDESITLKELLPIVLACSVWGPGWQGSTVIFYCDNTGAVAVINSGYSRIPQIMHLLRCLFFIRAYFQISVRAVHIPGQHNCIADAISRNNLDYFFSQVPQAASRCTIVPRNLLKLLVEQQPDWTSPAWTRLFRSCFPQV